MRKIPSVRTITKNNKNVDAKQLAEGLKLSKQLRKFGTARPVRKLVSPLFRKRASFLK